MPSIPKRLRPLAFSAGMMIAAGQAAFAQDASPKGYLVAEIAVTNPAAYPEYVEKVGPMVAAHGGRYIVRAGASNVLEGRALEGRLVVLEFPSLAAARAFYESPEYRAILALRTHNATSRVVLIEGYGR